MAKNASRQVGSDGENFNFLTFNYISEPNILNKANKLQNTGIIITKSYNKNINYLPSTILYISIGSRIKSKDNESYRGPFPVQK